MILPRIQDRGLRKCLGPGDLNKKTILVVHQSRMLTLLGHEKNIELLKRYATEDRPAHAYLFSGRQGIGKKTAAFEFARMVNCPEFFNHAETFECHTCKRILSNAHPDIHLELPDRNLIRIDAVRKILSFLKYPPIEGQYRIVIIDEAHLMNRSAQNAMLKTLEEPPPNRMIILVSSQPSSLLQTVRSRLRQISFGPLSEEHLRTLLSREEKLTEHQIETALAMAAGSLERARLKSSPENIQFRSSVISAIFEDKDTLYRDVMELSAEAGVEKSKTTDLLEIVSSVIRDALVTNLGAESSLINSDYGSLIKRLSQNNSPSQLMRVYDEVLRASARLDLDVNLSRNLVLDVTFLKIESILTRI